MPQVCSSMPCPMKKTYTELWRSTSPYPRSCRWFKRRGRRRSMPVYTITHARASSSCSARASVFVGHAGRRRCVAVRTGSCGLHARCPDGRWWRIRSGKGALGGGCLRQGGVADSRATHVARSLRSGAGPPGRTGARGSGSREHAAPR
eukprot:5607265-Pleurochrysis_carterae.AAC.2